MTLFSFVFLMTLTPRLSRRSPTVSVQLQRNHKRAAVRLQAVVCPLFTLSGVLVFVSSNLWSLHGIFNLIAQRTNLLAQRISLLPASLLTCLLALPHERHYFLRYDFCGWLPQGQTQPKNSVEL
jgi:hypothetical protein